jgi:hypothetical protein
VTLDAWYWIILVLCLLFGIWWDVASAENPFPRRGFKLVAFVLFVLIGLRNFGSPVK